MDFCDPLKDELTDSFPVESISGFFFLKLVDLPAAGDVVAELTYLPKLTEVLVIMRIVLVELLRVFIPVCVLLKFNVSPLFGVCMNLELLDINDISDPDCDPFIYELFVP